MTTVASPNDTAAPNWRHVAVFLALTFGLTWLIDLGLYLHGGLDVPGAVTAIQFQMLMPAFSAIVLGLFVFPESPLYHRRSAGRGRWFYYYFMLLTLIYALGVLAMWLMPTQGVLALVAPLTQLVAFLGLLVLVGLRLYVGREAMARVGLAWGGWRYVLLLGLAIAAFYVLQALLNAVTGLGPASLAQIPAPPGFSPAVFVMVGGVQSVLLAPFLAIVLAFGEEYGWRGYLQRELFKVGRVRGVLVLGVIWGAWHWPLILMGFSYPGYPLFGLLLASLFLIGLAVVLGYAVLKTGSILLAAYLHALNDQVTGFLVALGLKPYNPVFSFGVGVYAIVTLAILVPLLLRDPLWRGRGSPPG